MCNFGSVLHLVALAALPIATLSLPLVWRNTSERTFIAEPSTYHYYSIDPPFRRSVELLRRCHPLRRTLGAATWVLADATSASKIGMWSVAWLTAAHHASFYLGPSSTDQE